MSRWCEVSRDRPLPKSRPGNQPGSERRKSKSTSRFRLSISDGTCCCLNGKQMSSAENGGGGFWRNDVVASCRPAGSVKVSVRIASQWSIAESVLSLTACHLKHRPNATFTVLDEIGAINTYKTFDRGNTGAFIDESKDGSFQETLENKSWRAKPESSSHMDKLATSVCEFE